MALLMVRNGAVRTPVPVLSLPFGATCTQPHPSSTRPSQSSSMLLPQVSLAAAALGAHVPGLPFTHAGTTFTHAPVPQLMVPRPSSIAPLQLSSTPLHDSGVGNTSPMHEPSLPPTQNCVPALQ